MRDRSFNKAIIDPVIARDTFVYGISIGEELEPTHYWRDRTKHGTFRVTLLKTRSRKLWGSMKPPD